MNNFNIGTSLNLFMQPLNFVLTKNYKAKESMYKNLFYQQMTSFSERKTQMT